MKIRNIIFLVYIFVSIEVLAQNASQLQLINQNNRPSVEQVLENPHNLIEYSGSDFQGRATAINENLPAFIVSLEKAFPGGIYAFLGRDMDLIADAVDTFYLLRGQSGRVKRIEFSTPSLTGSTPELITSYLSQRGLDSEATRSSQPFVIIDYTSYANTGRTNSSFPSQARYIFQSVVTTMLQKGISEKDILERVNVATLDSTARSNIGLSDPLIDDRTSFIESQAQSLRTLRKIDRMTLLNSSGDRMAYHSEWTDKFGPIQKDGNGSLITQPLSYFSGEVKTVILLQIIKTINFVSASSMKQRIDILAAQYGVDFTFVSKKIKPLKINYDKNFKNQLSAILDNLVDLPKEKKYSKKNIAGSALKLTENGARVLDVLTQYSHISADHYFEISLEALIEMYKKNKIGARDFRRIFAYIIGLKPIESDGIVKMALNKYKEILPLEILLARAGEREKYSHQGGLAQENYKKLIKNGELKLSCKFYY